MSFKELEVLEFRLEGLKLKVVDQFCKSLQVDGSACGSGTYANIVDHVCFSSGSALHIVRRNTITSAGMLWSSVKADK